MNSLTRMSAVTAALLAGTLTFTACGSTSHDTSSMPGMNSSTTSNTSNSGAPAAGPHNDADISFATDMIPHHAQAIEMAGLALKQATDAQVKTLAAAVKNAQDPEIKRMSGWLTGWGKPIPNTTMNADMAGMDMGGGMMTMQEMTDLSKASGTAFDRMWLQMMINHHRGAVAMAKDEIAKGANTDAKSLARAIAASQSAEISRMTTLLTKLG